MVIVVKGTGAMNVDLRGLAEGEPVSLVPEPTNPYDPNAIRVMKGERLLGYVAKELARRIDARDYEARILAVLPHPKTGVPAGLRISIEKPVR